LPLPSVLFMMATSHISSGAEGQLSPYIEKWIIHNTIFFLLMNLNILLTFTVHQFFPR
jgi:hypothetical protein